MCWSFTNSDSSTASSVMERFASLTNQRPPGRFNAFQYITDHRLQRFLKGTWHITFWDYITCKNIAPMYKGNLLTLNWLSLCGTGWKLALRSDISIWHTQTYSMSSRGARSRDCLMILLRASWSLVRLGGSAPLAIKGQDNLGPFSQFTNVSFDPPTILFIGHQSAYKRRSKDSVVNARETGEFVWSMATWVLWGLNVSLLLYLWNHRYDLRESVKICWWIAANREVERYKENKRKEMLPVISNKK